MGVFQQCPICRIKQKTSLKKCRHCGEDLIKAKKSSKVRYWICNQIQGKKRWKSIGFSLQEAQDADGKIRAQKRENPFFDLKDSRLTFSELTKWYTELVNIQRKDYFSTLVARLKNWNVVYGDKMVVKLRKSDVENYQHMRLDAKYAESTIDQEVGAARTMVQAAIDDDRISGDCIKPFRKVGKLLKGASNARDKIITLDQLFGIFEQLPDYLHGIISLGFFAGMRLGEILGLTWNKIYLNSDISYIKLESIDTKERRTKIIPLACKIKKNPYEILRSIPKALHDNHIFLFQGKPIDKKRVHRNMERACTTVGIPYGRFTQGGLIFHDLRHCFNTYMRRAGVDQLTIMTIMGHSPGRGLEMTYRYSTFELADLWQAVGKMEDYLMEQLIFNNERNRS